MRPTRTRAGWVAAVAALSLTVAACSGSTDSGTAASDSAESGTLKLWHYEGPDSAMGVAWNQAIKEFEQTHPGVKVKFEEKGFEQILRGDDGPGAL